MPTFTLTQLAEHVDGQLEGEPERPISGVAPIDRAGVDDLSFVTADRYLLALAGRAVGAVITTPELGTVTGDIGWILVDDPQLAFARLLPLFFPPDDAAPGVSGTARLGRGVRLGAAVSIQHHVVIEADATIGDRTTISSGTFIGRGATIGADCRIGHACSILAGVVLGDRVQLHPGVRLGTDGYGYVQDETGAVAVPQVGGLTIGDDVDVGANTTIDRGALGDTRIGARTKIDNLVHIGHNVEVGEDCMIVAQVGVAGSARIGRGAQLAGQAGIKGHLSIGPGARIAAQAGVIGDVPAGASYSGYPARPHAEAMRASAALRQLPRALVRLRALEQQVFPRQRADEEDEEP